MTMPRFHLAFPVTDLEAARAFYTEVLGARVARSADRWIDFDFWGHQLSAHLVDTIADSATNPVDGEHVPARHFGVILPPEQWRSLASRVASSGARFLIEPQVRFEGKVGEQSTFFMRDPSGNALEFKAFASDSQVFARSS